jgi:hypothetical protein
LDAEGLLLALLTILHLDHFDRVYIDAQAETISASAVNSAKAETYSNKRVYGFVLLQTQPKRYHDVGIGHDRQLEGKLVSSRTVGLAST